ncbi:MAG TPA: hypothetical protein PK402_13485 [Tepidisphaeraceae bacterium]|nr:hypothetical protein [Tepidisphaeraceae bacterium]
MMTAKEDLLALDVVMDDVAPTHADPARTNAVRSILKLIELLPAQEPSPGLVDSTVKLVQCDPDSNA